MHTHTHTHTHTHIYRDVCVFQHLYIYKCILCIYIYVRCVLDKDEEMK